MPMSKATHGAPSSCTCRDDGSGRGVQQAREFSRLPSAAHPSTPTTHTNTRAHAGAHELPGTTPHTRVVAVVVAAALLERRAILFIVHQLLQQLGHGRQRGAPIQHAARQLVLLLHDCARGGGAQRRASATHRCTSAVGVPRHRPGQSAPFQETLRLCIIRVQTNPPPCSVPMAVHLPHAMSSLTCHGVGAVGVLQPAVRVVDSDAVQHFRRVVTVHAGVLRWQDRQVARRGACQAAGGQVLGTKSNVLDAEASPGSIYPPSFAHTHPWRPAWGCSASLAWLGKQCSW